MNRREVAASQGDITSPPSAGVLSCDEGATLREFVAGSQECVFGIDAQGCVRDWSPGAERLYGYPAEEIVGRSISLVEAPHAQGMLSRLVAQSTEQRGGPFFEAPHRTREGQPLAVELSITSWSSESQHVIVVRDQSAVKRHERALLDAVHRRDEFLAMLSHELRNPLSAVLNAAYLLQRATLTPSAEHSTEIILRQSQQMARLLDDLLDVARVTLGKVELRQEVFDLREIAADAIEVAQPVIDSKGLRLSVHLPKQPLWVQADRARLLQVEANLLRNAVKYTPAGERIEFALQREGDEILIRVRDTGMGISPEHLTRIFDLFVQADISRDRSDGGMGVGLTLVKSVVEMHGGSVVAFSEGLGRGSEFLVRLPAASPPDAIRPREETEAERCIRRVVVVEDLDDSRHLLQVLLETEGLEVRSAEDGLTGLHLIETYQPDLALIDIGLPGLNGFEVARRLRRHRARPILVALTGYGQDSDRQAVRAAGFDAHLVKPLQLDELRRVLAGDLSEAQPES